MKIGRFYRSDKSKAIVVCTGNNNSRVFSGTVVDGGLAGYDIGYSSYRWSVPSFKPCDVMRGFMLEDSHDIPYEHITTSKDSEVLTDKVNEANAQLIATAPELLEASIMVAEMLNFNKGEEIPEDAWNANVDNLLCIINKALGL